MRVPATTDLIQSEKKIKVPEIRVWCHPHKIGKAGSDYYEIFGSFKEALGFIKKHKEAEEVPLIAFGGFELNLWAMSKEARKK